MKTKYFEYNRNSGSEKYSEFTEAEYLKAKEEEKEDIPNKKEELEEKIENNNPHEMLINLYNSRNRQKE